MTNVTFLEPDEYAKKILELGEHVEYVTLADDSGTWMIQAATDIDGEIYVLDIPRFRQLIEGETNAN